jgi:hypothetical protein
MKNLIDWSNFDRQEYRSTGEGGLFVYAIWGVPLNGTECCVDVTPQLPFGNLQHVSGPLSEEVTKWDIEASRTQGGEYPSYEVENILLIGHTWDSYFSDFRGEYAGVDENDLTEEGREILDALSVVYGSKPTLVTFLDT